jgi:type VI secretion system protein
MRALLIPLFVLLSALAGCSSAPPKTAIGSIKIVAETGANQNTATALDIVFVYDTTSASLLPKTGPDWFDKKAALMNGLAKGVDVVSLQIPPAMIVDVPLPKRYDDAIGVYSFANYIDAAGQPVGNLTPYKKMTIRLTPDNVVYSGT